MDGECNVFASSSSSSSNVNASSTNVDSQQYEETHVHQVYNSIASHFSSTRFKPWPVVHSFLLSQPTGSVGLDIGTGNGKYLSVRDDLFIIGSDRSSELLKFAGLYKRHDVLVADTLSLPHCAAPLGGGGNTVDFVICIAVLHHLSTRQRRRDGVREILACLSTSKTSGRGDSTGQRRGQGQGEALIFVWALEQASSRRGWDVGCDQDVMVPWVLKNQSQTQTKKGREKKREMGDVQGFDTGGEKGVTGENGAEQGEMLEEQKDRVYKRYYHLYREGELEEDVEAVGGRIVRKGYDRDNWWVVCVRRDDCEQSNS